MKKNNFLTIVSILSFIVILLGSTFSYFAISATSNENAVGVTAMKFDTNVEITPLYNSKPLIPMDDADVMTAYNQNCIDDFGFGACYAYNIDITNNGIATGYSGTIKFNITDIQNLKYLLLDENNEIYHPISAINNGEDESLGDSFELDTNETQGFVLIIWLSNLEEIQDDYDAGGNFSALVTYESTSGSRISGSFSVNNG